MKTRALLTGAILLCVQLPGYASAATQSMTANIAFDAPLAMAKNNDINFGLVMAGQAGAYTMSPNGTVTVSNGGHILGGTPQGGSFTITGSATQAVDISTGNYTADHGVIPSAVTCAYNGEAGGPCMLDSQVPPGNGKPLLIGVTVNVDGSQKTGDHAAPTFDVIVNYH